MINILEDLLNLVYVFSLVTIVFYKYKISIIFYVTTLVSISFVFLFNDMLFPSMYMPDQYGYLEATTDARRMFYPEPIFSSIQLTGIIFAYFPMPIISSLASIAFINKLFYAFMLVVSVKNNLLNNKCGVLFFIFYPSILLYSSLATRDIMVLLFMFLSTYYLIIKKKVVVGLLLSVPLYFLKPQNFVMLILALVMAFSIELVAGRVTRHKPSILLLMSILCISIVVPTYSFRDKIIYKLNYARESMYMSDYQLKPTGVGVDGFEYKGIYDIQDVLREGTEGLKNLLFRPYITEAENVFQLIQSAENIITVTIIIGILFMIIRYRIFNYGMNYLLSLYLFHIIAYGLVVFNLGTIARYKFPFIFIFIIFSTYIIKRNRNESHCSNVMLKEVPITNCVAVDRSSPVPQS